MLNVEKIYEDLRLNLRRLDNKMLDIQKNVREIKESIIPVKKKVVKKK